MVSTKVAHSDKSPIKWTVMVDVGEKMLCIEPVDEVVNRIFKYSLCVSIDESEQIYGSCDYYGDKIKFNLRGGSNITSIQIKIIYPSAALVFSFGTVKTPSSMESITALPKMVTKWRSRTEFIDVQFMVEKKLIVAHKMVLADRSEVFRKIFMWNKDTEPIQIADISYDGFHHFIDTIYSGKTPTDPKICLEMVGLAETYDIQDIKTAVEASIIASISIDNAIFILICSYLNKADRIKKAALNFCAINPIHEMNGTKELSKYPDLLIEVFKRICTTKKL